jgi:hypothetical protein
LTAFEARFASGLKTHHTRETLNIARIADGSAATA